MQWSWSWSWPKSPEFSLCDRKSGVYMTTSLQTMLCVQEERHGLLGSDYQENTIQSDSLRKRLRVSQEELSRHPTIIEKCIVNGLFNFYNNYSLFFFFSSRLCCRLFTHCPYPVSHVSRYSYPCAILPHTDSGLSLVLVNGMLASLTPAEYPSFFLFLFKFYFIVA